MVQRRERMDWSRQTGTERERRWRFFFSFSFWTHLLSTPPSSEAFRHSGGERRLCTSATVTLYFDVELSRDRRPGTEQNTSLGFTTPPKSPSLFTGMEERLLFLDKDTGPSNGGKEREGMEEEGEGRERERPCSVNFMQCRALTKWEGGI